MRRANYLKERSKEVLTGSSYSIVVRLFGPELATLRLTAKEIEKVMGTIEGVSNLKVESQSLLPQIEIRLHPDAGQLYGLTPGQVRRVTSTLLKGTKVGEIYEAQKRFDVVVWSEPEFRNDLTALRNLPIETATGVQVRLGDVADVLVVRCRTRSNAKVRHDVLTFPATSRIEILGQCPPKSNVK